MKIHSRRFLPVWFSDIFQKFNKSAFVCYPNIVLTEFSTTNLHHDYTLTEKEDLYYNNCFIDLCFQDYNFIYLGLFIKNKEFVIFDFSEYGHDIDVVEHIFGENSINYINRLNTKKFTVKVRQQNIKI